MRLNAKEVDINVLLDRYLPPGSQVLNNGSSDVRSGRRMVNLDVVPGANVDVVADAHDLPFDEGTFDGCVLSAVLQYCRNPFRVVSEAHRVLRNQGYVLVDVPFVQPYCPERVAVDRFRVTHPGLVDMFNSHFDVVESGVSIAGGSAWALLCRSIADTCSRNRYVSAGLRLAVSALAWPISRLRFGRRHEVACALYLVGRKREPAP